MLQQTAPLSQLLDSVSHLTGKSREQQAIHLVDQYLSKSSDEMCTLVASALIEAIPPEQGKTVLLRLQILGTYWAFALVKLAYPSLDTAEIRTNVIQRSFRLRNRLQARLIKEGYSAHCELFAALDDRFWALSKLPAMVRRFATNSAEAEDQSSCFLEPVIIAGTIKASLRSALMKHYYVQLSAKQKDLFRSRLYEALDCGFDAPWTPELAQSELDKGIDILIDEGLARVGPLGMVSLISQIKPQNLIEPKEKIGFLRGLTKNDHFRQSASHTSKTWGFGEIF